MVHFCLKTLFTKQYQTLQLFIYKWYTEEESSGHKYTLPSQGITQGFTRLNGIRNNIIL